MKSDTLWLVLFVLVPLLVGWLIVDQWLACSDNEGTFVRGVIWFECIQ